MPIGMDDLAGGRGQCRSGARDGDGIHHTKERELRLWMEYNLKYFFKPPN
jgi:hypothetical protein